jgi:hypothetical protein
MLLDQSAKRVKGSPKTGRTQRSAPAHHGALVPRRTPDQGGAASGEIVGSSNAAAVA